MLLAIDVGNTHMVFGVWDGGRWVAVWRHRTDETTTEDELAVWLRGMFDLAGLPWRLDGAICASVAPTMNTALDRLCSRWLGQELVFLRNGASVGLVVEYEPKTSVGADRLANALGAREKYPAPIVVVDFGTGTNFDAIDREGRYLGGAIMPGVLVGSDALFKRAAKLPHVGALDLVPPPAAIGRNTVQSLQSGIVLGYAGAIDALAGRMVEELGGDASVVATGGLGNMFLGVCERIQTFDANLTLDGLRVAWEKSGRD